MKTITETETETESLRPKEQISALINAGSAPL